MWFKTKTKVDSELDLYKGRRKLEIDEELSEWRRSQKNRATQEVMEETETIRQNAQAMTKEAHEAEKTHAVKLVSTKAELQSLEDKKTAKLAEIAQAETDFEARGLLRDRACKAEKERAELVAAEKDKHIAHLETHLKSVTDQNNGLLATLAKALGDAAGKEVTTKVVGFGPSSEPKKV